VEMYGKVMSIPDSIIVRWSTLLLGRSGQELERRLEAGENPRDLKAQLAFGLVERFAGEDGARLAQDQFERVFRNREVPEDAPELSWPVPWSGPALELVAGLPEMPSRGEAKRLLLQGAVSLNGARLALGDTVEVTAGQWIKVGKRRYFWLAGSSSEKG